MTPTPATNVGTNLGGRLRNTPLPFSHGLLPLFEAIVNSIHAIEEAGGAAEQGLIRVAIQREPQTSLIGTTEEGTHRPPGPTPRGEISGFAVTDNGIGFDDENFDAFRTLDTDHKVSKGGRGIGRLLWLKAFDRVEIESTFVVGTQLRGRRFEFRPTGIKGGAPGPATSLERGTTVRLVGFGTRYRSSARKTCDAIANALSEHCLWYFVRPGGPPKIFVEDDGERIALDEVFEHHMHSSAVHEQVPLKGQLLDLLHVKLRAHASAFHAIAFCADNRLVAEERLLGRLPGLHGKLRDEQGEFVYLCYVSSPVLDAAVRPERSGFDLPDQIQGLFEKTDLSWEDIRGAVVAKAAGHLAAQLEQVRQRASARVESFVSTKAPRYRPILKRLSKDQLNIDPDLSDKDLELALHRHLAELERELLTEGHDLMAPKGGESADSYRTRVHQYLSKAEDIKRSDLASYVAHRRVVLDLLDAAIKRRPDGRYQREDLIHTLIMPMRTTSNEVLLDNCNLWLVDERLAFHDYLASDKALSAMPITGSVSSKEPDLVALNVFDNPILVSDSPTPPLASIVVIELKRPMRDGAQAGEERDPIEQAIGYLDRIRQGRVTTAQGRPIPSSEDIPGFCYVICDITPSVEQRCKVHDLTRTSDGLGYFAYKKNYKAYVEVISFDRLVAAAKERNRAFFDKLGLPTR